MLTRKNGYFARWANQRYNLIRNMPIYTWVFNSDYVGFDQKSILYAVDIKDGLLGENFMNKNDFFRIRQKFSSTTVDPGFQIGYYAYVNGSYINTQYLENVQVNQLSPVDFDFSVVMLHKAVLNDSFGTGLSDGQIWSESISGFGTRTYSYTLPVSQDFKYIQQDSYVNIRILPQNNPWITGGI